MRTTCATLAALALLAAVLLAPRPLDAQESHSCAAHGSMEQHHAGVDARGDRMMGFDHAKTTHHFLLAKDGGSIEVTANDETDSESRDAIRSHLAHIAKMFAEGNFEAPMLIHDRVPPGVPVLKERKASVQWSYGDLPRGGRVVAQTKDRQAIAALHDFLRFQIEDHRTGDSGKIEEARPANR